MSRGERFEFSQDVQSAAHRRQKGLCALCGSNVAWMYSPAHAVFRPKVGESAGNDWKHGIENCVILCESCASWAKEEGEHPVTAPMLPEDFKYSHGKLAGGHRVWLNRMMGR